MRTKFEHTHVYGIRDALRGMRNPLESWGKNDTISDVIQFPPENPNIEVGRVAIKDRIGKNDMDLACRLIHAPEERKFLRQIFISVDITAPAYWWAEFDTFKVGVTRNSTSFMHKGTSRAYTENDFETITTRGLEELNHVRDLYLEAEDNEKKRLFLQLRSLCPMGYLYKSTISMNYENVMNMFRQRKNHRLPHWRVDFCTWALSLPYMRKFLLAAGIIDENYEPKE